MMKAKAQGPRARAGMSSMRLRLGRRVGEKHVMTTITISRLGLKRRASKYSDATRRKLKGNCHNFQSKGHSPNRRTAREFQYRLTGGASTCMAGSGSWYQKI